jgi:hypothetical protein
MEKRKHSLDNPPGNVVTERAICSAEVKPAAAGDLPG